MNQAIGVLPKLIEESAKACRERGESFTEEQMPFRVFRAIDGDTIVSRINTTFAYDQTGTAIAQAPQGYNVAPYFFQAIVDDGGVETNVLVPAFFTTQAIRAGAELRWNYGCRAEEIRRIA